MGGNKHMLWITGYAAALGGFLFAWHRLQTRLKAGDQDPHQFADGDCFPEAGCSLRRTSDDWGRCGSASTSPTVLIKDGLNEPSRIINLHSREIRRG